MTNASATNDFRSKTSTTTKTTVSTISRKLSLISGCCVAVLRGGPALAAPSRGAGANSCGDWLDRVEEGTGIFESDMRHLVTLSKLRVPASFGVANCYSLRLHP